MARWSGLQRLVLIFATVLSGSGVLAQYCRSNQTERGNSGGAACTFPFLYRNKYYSECTGVDNRGVRWCATTINYDRDEKWGRCICDLSAPQTPCTEKTVSGKSCARPFFYKGRAYYGCTTFENKGVNWCSLDKVYNNRWERCASLTCPIPDCRSDITDGGNSNGASCSFPFSYKGKPYTACTDVDNRGVKWCATTSNYDTNRKWGRCICDLATPAPKVDYCRSDITVGGNARGAACVLPFIYRGVSYTECTVADNAGRKWCATTSNYNLNKAWGNCVCGLTETPAPTKVPLFCTTDRTVGGNANGRKCSLPFLYKRNLYNSCTAVDNRNRPWCATTGNYDADRQWGNCICDQLTTQGPTVAQTPCRSDATQRGNSRGAACTFPFIYKQKTYTACTAADNNGIRWCSTTFNYDNDKKWGRCICSDDLIPTPAPSPSSGCYLDRTTAGNARGAACVVPFIYKGNSYSDCTNADNGNVLWCATTRNYDINRQWGRCICTPTQAPTASPPGGGTPGAVTATTSEPCVDRTADGRPCSFPFIYEGNSYSSCINLMNMGVFWCSLTPNYDSDFQWANCALPVCNPVVTPAPGPSGTVPVFVGSCRSDITERGNSNGAPCAFPFSYRGNTYNECTMIDNPRPWCATTASYDRDMRWGACLCVTTATTTERPPATNAPGPAPGPAITPSTAPPPDTGCRADRTTGGNGAGSRCIFPFRYRGNQYTSCVTFNNDVPWCAVTANYDRDFLWGNCICGSQPQPTPAPNMNTATTTTSGGMVTATVGPSTTQRTTPILCRELTTEGLSCPAVWVYDGRTYRGCTTDFYGGVYWCSLFENYNGEFGICRIPLRCTSVPGTPNPQPPPPPPPPPPTAAPTPAPPPSPSQCIVFTTAGQCFFPFLYKNVPYNNCTLVDNNVLWCSLTDNYNRDGRLGLCTDFSRCRR